MEHWLEREIAQWIHHEGSIRRSALTTELHLNPTAGLQSTLGACVCAHTYTLQSAQC